MFFRNPALTHTLTQLLLRGCHADAQRYICSMSAKAMSRRQPYCWLKALVESYLLSAEMWKSAELVA